MIPQVTYRVVRHWAFDEINEREVQAFVERVMADVRSAPTFFGKAKRGDHNLFEKTGHLIEGLTFKPASLKKAKTGVIGWIKAPADRFANNAVLRNFQDRLDGLWSSLGVGFASKGL